MTFIHVLFGNLRNKIVFALHLFTVQSLAGYKTLTYSSIQSSRVIFPENAPGTQNAGYPYPSNITEVPDARWIWSGFGNQKQCPMTITIRDQVNITCLSQPVILYAAADNQFTAEFFGETMSGNDWAKPVSLAIDPKSSSCNGKYYFTITAVNQPNTKGVGCQNSNWAAVIYGVIQKDPDICCDSNAQFYNSSTCQCYPCSNLFPGCLTCTINQCLTCDVNNHFFLNNKQCFCTTNKYVLNNSICTQCNQFITNCTLCENSTHCIQCSTGSKLNSTYKCEPCEIGCIDCNATQCFLCDTNEGFSLQGGKCICPVFQGILVNTCELCNSMITNCTKCLNNTYCNECTIGNTIDSNHLCTQCSQVLSGCIYCQNSTHCTQCQTGFKLNLNNQCELCQVGCINCNINQCLLCDISQGFQLINGHCFCPQFQGILHNTCELCNIMINNCTKCLNNTFCTECTIGNTLNISHQCEQCNKFITNCSKCDNQTYCTQCLVGSKLDQFNQCEPCQIGCIDCNVTQCFICDNNKGFLLNHGQCVCPQQQGILMNTCQLCISMIINCIKCFNNTYCTQCKNGSMVNSIFVCQSCGFKCLTCQFISGCSICQIGYHVYLGQCISKCGDGITILHSNQYCDDGNLVDGDGCNHLCEIEQNYTCIVQNMTSICSYSGAFRLYVRFLTKQYYKNQISISIGIRPNHTILNQLNFSSAIDIHNSLISTSYFYNPNGTIYVNYNFTQTLEKQNLNLIFNPASTSPHFYFTPSTTIPIEITTNSNIPIAFYEDSYYSHAKLIQKLFVMTLAITYFLTFLSMITTGKAINVQLLFVWQVIFLSLSSVDKISPIPSGFFSLNIVNGYNIISPLDNRQLPERVNAISYQSNIYQNINIILVILLFFLLILPSIIYAFSVVLKKYKRKIKTISLFIAKQYALMFVLFCTINISYSGGIQLLYGEQSMINFLILGVNVVIILISFVLRLYLKKREYGQFYASLKPQWQCKFYFNVNLIYRFILGGVLSLFNQSTHVVIYALSISIFFLIYQLSVKPFKNGYHNYGSISFQICIVLILGMRMFYRGFKNNYPIQQISRILVPGYIQAFLIVICTLVNIAIMIYDIIIKFCKKSFKKHNKQLQTVNLKFIATSAILSNNIEQEPAVDYQDNQITHFELQ